MQAGGKPGRPRKRKKAARTGDALNDILANTIANEEAAHNAYQADTTQAVLLSNHTKAAEAVAKIERMVREEQERRGLLVLKSDIIERCRRGLAAVLQRIDKLPKEQGPQCNPQEPVKASIILQRAVDEIKEAVKSALSE